MRESQLTGRLRLRHLQEHTEAVGESMATERTRFQALADPSNATRAVSSFNLFQTPEPIADRMAGMLMPLDGLRVLEPSAGLGRLYRAVRLRAACPMVLVEQSAECAGELYRAIGDDDARLVQADFLACTPERLGGLFDAVIMNPPFKQGADIKHIRHALTMLRPGGRMVALCASGPRQQAQLRPLADEWHALPAGSFKSEGTRVAAALLMFRR